MTKSLKYAILLIVQQQGWELVSATAGTPGAFAGAKVRGEPRRRKMSKKNVSAIVSGAGFLAAVWTVLVSAVHKLGGTDEQIHRLATPEGAETVEKMAALIVGKPEQAASWWATIFTALIRACGFTWQNQNVTAENFPNSGEPGQVEVVSIKARLAELGRQWLSTVEVKVYLDSLGLRPATLLELILWWLANPAKHANCLVVALGQVWQSYVPSVYGDGGFRYLNLYTVRDGWSEVFEFAAVRK